MQLNTLDNESKGRVTRILCYGDSNTWGYNPKDSSRFDESNRWSAVLKELLPDVTIFENGLNGRTVLDLNPCNKAFSALFTIREDIKEIIPLDIIIFFLGTNDAASGGGVSSGDIAEGMKRLVEICKEIHLTCNFKIPQFIIISPPAINRDCPEALVLELEINKILSLVEVFRDVALHCGACFFDISKIVKTSEVDLFHLDAEAHKKIALNLSDFLKLKGLI